MTVFTSEAEVMRISAGFGDQTLPAKDFTHAAHFATALCLLREHGDQAEILMPAMIRAFNVAKGGQNTDTEGYHHTITVASIRAAASFLSYYTQGTLVFNVTNALMQTRLGEKDWLLEYWSKPVLFTQKARKTWVLPDVAPFPWLAPAVIAD